METNGRRASVQRVLMKTLSNRSLSCIEWRACRDSVPSPTIGKELTHHVVRRT